MQPSTRVFVAADTNGDARRLGKVFRESVGFVVVGVGLIARLPQLEPLAIDVLVAESRQSTAAHALSQFTMPALWLVPRNAIGMRDLNGANAVLPFDVAPAQIRAAAAAVAAGLHVEQAARNQVHSAEDAEIAFQEPLTERELEVLNLLADGLSNPNIAKRLGVSRNTVKFHVSSIIGKLGANSRTEAVTLGLKRGLIII